MIIRSFQANQAIVRLVLKLAVLTPIIASAGCSNSSSDEGLANTTNNKIESSTSAFSSEASSSRQPNSSFSSAASTANEISPPQGALSFDNTLCGEFTITTTQVIHNTYTLDAPAGDCFGILEDGSQKRELPLSIQPTSPSNNDISIGATAKLYNSFEYGRYRWSSITIELTNTTDEPICFINPVTDLLSLYNKDHQEIALVSVDNYLEGALYPLRFVGNTNTCLAPGQTMPYSSDSIALPANVVNAASYAIIPPIEGSTQPGVLVKPSLTLTSLSTRPDDASISAEFVNDSGSAIALSYLNRVIFYTEDGYAASYSFIDLAGDNEIIESGDLFVLQDSFFSIYDYKPIHASRAIIYLEWEFEEE